MTDKFNHSEVISFSWILKILESICASSDVDPDGWEEKEFKDRCRDTHYIDYIIDQDTIKIQTVVSELSWLRYINEYYLLQEDIQINEKYYMENVVLFLIDQTSKVNIDGGLLNLDYPDRIKVLLDSTKESTLTLLRLKYS